MEFYSFRFGDMKVVQADAASPKLVAVEMGFGFRMPDRHTVESLTLTVHIPHDPNQTVTATQQEAFSGAVALLRSAADYCSAKSPEQLCQETERNKAFAVTSQS
jgi:hypothetical protein